MLINKTRNKREATTADTEEIQRILRMYFNNSCSLKLESMEEMDEFVHTYGY